MNIINNTNTNNKQNNNNFKEDFINHTFKNNEIIINLLSIFIAFYGILYAPQVVTLLTCQQNEIIKHNKLYQYIFTFGIFYFVVVLINKSEIELPPIQKLFNCFIYFILFIILNRLDYTINVTVLGLCCFIYFIYLNTEYYFTVDPETNIVQLNNNLQNSTKLVSIINKDSLNLEQSAKTIKTHQYWITFDYPFIIKFLPVRVYQYYYLTMLIKIIIIIIIILIIFGFIHYLGLLKYTFNNNITLYNIFFGTPTCKPLNFNLTFFDYILLAFDYKYYIKKINK